MRIKRIFFLFFVIFCCGLMCFILFDFQDGDVVNELQSLSQSNKTDKLYNINGNSMYPTFRNGDKVKVDFSVDEFDRGDIVIFRFKTRDEVFVKRIVAVGGDSVVFGKDRNIYVNNEILNESYVNGKSVPSLKSFGLLLKQLEYYDNVIPDGSVLVMGDNREKSYDSSSYGLIPEEYVLGKVVVVE